VKRRELITLLGGAAANGPSSLKRVCRLVNFSKRSNVAYVEACLRQHMLC
jgi:hypothetical protein